MVRVIGEVRIARSPESVFEAAADERTHHDGRARRVEMLTDGPVGAGSCFEVTSSSTGLSTIVEITDYKRPLGLTSTTHLWFGEIQRTLVLEPLDGGTRLHWASQVRPHAALQLLAPVLAALVERQSRQRWAAMKRRLEAERHPVLAG